MFIDHQLGKRRNQETFTPGWTHATSKRTISLRAGLRRIRNLSERLKRWGYMVVMSAAFSVVVFAGQAEAEKQDQRSGWTVERQYDTRLDQVFGVATLRDARFVIVLRFLPPFSAEEQIVVTYGMKSETRLQYRVASRQIGMGFGVSENTDQPSATDTIQTDTTSLTLSSKEGQAILAGFFGSLTKTTGPMLTETMRGQEQGVVFLRMDESRYYARFEDVSSGVVFRVNGSDLDAPDRPAELELARWMKHLRKEVRQGTLGRNY